MVRIVLQFLLLPLAACSSYDYAEQTGGLFERRNSPLPVPHPRTKPSPPLRRAELVDTAQPTRQQNHFAEQGRGQSVLMQKGDTVYGLARRYDIPVKDLISYNRLKPPYVLAVGQRLSIPAANFYTVTKGDTGSKIATRFGVQLSALMQLNNIQRPYILSVGQKLKLPGGAASVDPGKKKSVKFASHVSESGENSVKKSSVRKKNLIAPPRRGAGFSWPLSGEIVSRFGPKPGGQRNEGLNIAAAKGTPVRAAQSGIVVYANNGIEGYGNLLLLKHSDGWITAYAHNDRILVAEGQKVDRGQIVARVGKTGGVKIPQLHFEIRKGRTTYNPLKYLGKK